MEGGQNRGPSCRCEHAGARRHWLHEQSRAAERSSWTERVLLPPRSRSDASEPSSQASFLIFDLGVDWRYGAAHFEEYLLDYDPCSNWGNWVARRHGAWGAGAVQDVPMSTEVAAAGLTGQRINKFNTKKQLSDYAPYLARMTCATRRRVATEPRIPSASMSTTGCAVSAKPSCGQVPILRTARPVGVQCAVGVFVSSAFTG